MRCATQAWSRARRSSRSTGGRSSIVRRIAPEIATVALTDQQPGEDTIEVGRPGPSPWLGGLDVDDFGGSVPKLVHASGARVWSPNYRDLDARLVAEAHALGLAVVPWTVNEPAEMRRVLDARRRRDDQRPTRPAALRARGERHRLAPGCARPMIGWLRPAPFTEPLPAGRGRSELPPAAPPGLRRHLRRLRGLLPGPQQPGARDSRTCCGSTPSTRRRRSAPR